MTHPASPAPPRPDEVRISPRRTDHSGKVKATCKTLVGLRPDAPGPTPKTTGLAQCQIHTQKGRVVIPARRTRIPTSEESLAASEPEVIRST